MPGCRSFACIECTFAYSCLCLYVRACVWQGRRGYYLHGWEKQFNFLSTKWEKVSLADRIAQVMWRGRTMDKEFPNRDELRCGRSCQEFD